MSNPSCPPPPSMDEQYSDIQKSLQALGADQKCKSYFDSGSKESSTSVSVAVQASLLFASASAATNVSTGASEMHNKMSQDGCGDVFANISEQNSARQSIMCQINNQQSTTSLSGSANANVSIRQRKMTDNELAVRQSALKLIGTIPYPPQPTYQSGMTPEIFKMLLESHKQDIAAYNEHAKIKKEMIESISGKVVIKNLSVKNKASVDMKVISNVQNISTTKIAESFKKVASAAAASEIKKRTGSASDTSRPTKSLVQNKINDKQQEITNSIKNSINSIDVSGNSSTGFELVFAGPMDMTDVVIDQFAQARIITKNIIKNAESLGKATALDLLSKTTSTKKVDTESKGMEDMMKQVQDGRVGLAKASTEGTASMMSAAGMAGFLALAGMAIIVLVFMKFGGGQALVARAKGPLGFGSVGGGNMMSILLGILVVGVVVYMLSSFNKSENNQEYATDDPFHYFNNLGSDYGGYVPMAVNHSWSHPNY